MNRRKATPRKTTQARGLRRAASATEQRLWRLLRSKRLGVKFRRRSLVYGYIPDVWCSEAKVAVEIDGKEYADKQDRERRTRHPVLLLWHPYRPRPF